jgi:hypothetical protein
MVILDKVLEKGWVVTINTKRNEVFATHPNIENYLDLEQFLIKYDLYCTPSYIRNNEAKRVPEHMLTGWAELLEHRLNNVPMVYKNL